MSYDYGNARVAALRARLLDPASLHRLAESGQPAAFVALLERAEDWRPHVREVSALGADPVIAVEAAIERHRASRLGGLRHWYDSPARGLVEATVVGLDNERVIAILRRRRSGASAESIGATIVGGAILGPAQLGRIARAPGMAAALGLLARFGLMRGDDVRALAALPAVDEPDEWARFEAALATALDRARLDRVIGNGPDAILVRTAIERATDDRATVTRELHGGGVVAAALVERSLTFERLDRLTRTARRDPLGIGPVLAYVAAVEAQAIRLRAALARVRAGWSEALVARWLTGGRERWPVSSS